MNARRPRAVAVGIALVLLVVSADLLAQTQEMPSSAAAPVGGTASAEIGPVYLDSSYQYYHGVVRTLGIGVGAALSAAWALHPKVGLGIVAQGATGIHPYVLIDGYQASVQENSFWLGAVGPLVEYRPTAGSLWLLGNAGFAITHMDMPATEVGTALGFGAGVGAGWDFHQGDMVRFALVTRATGTQTWENGTRINGLMAGLLLSVVPLVTGASS